MTKRDLKCKAAVHNLVNFYNNNSASIGRDIISGPDGPLNVTFLNNSVNKINRQKF